jgi:hypothetical protein
LTLARVDEGIVVDEGIGQHLQHFVVEHRLPGHIVVVCELGEDAGVGIAVRVDRVIVTPFLGLSVYLDGGVIQANTRALGSVFDNWPKLREEATTLL